MTDRSKQGWHQLPPHVQRCTCPRRVEAWARLDWEKAGRPCCAQVCCGAAAFAITVDAAALRRLRSLAVWGRWVCPRCGQPVERHDRGMECVDPGTRAIRALKKRRQR